MAASRSISPTSLFIGRRITNIAFTSTYTVFVTEDGNAWVRGKSFKGITTSSDAVKLGQLCATGVREVACSSLATLVLDAQGEGRVQVLSYQHNGHMLQPTAVEGSLGAGPLRSVAMGGGQNQTSDLGLLLSTDGTVRAWTSSALGAGAVNAGAGHVIPPPVQLQPTLWQSTNVTGMTCGSGRGALLLENGGLVCLNLEDPRYRVQIGFGGQTHGQTRVPLSAPAAGQAQAYGGYLLSVVVTVLGTASFDGQPVRLVACCAIGWIAVTGDNVLWRVSAAAVQNYYNSASTTVARIEAHGTSLFPARVEKIVASDDNILILGADGTVRTLSNVWGRPAGQVINRIAAGQAATAMPVQLAAGDVTELPSIKNATNVFGGFGHYAALCADGSCWMWGANGDDELGVPAEAGDASYAVDQYQRATRHSTAQVTAPRLLPDELYGRVQVLSTANLADGRVLHLAKDGHVYEAPASPADRAPSRPLAAGAGPAASQPVRQPFCYSRRIVNMISSPDGTRLALVDDRRRVWMVGPGTHEKRWAINWPTTEKPVRVLFGSGHFFAWQDADAAADDATVYISGLLTGSLVVLKPIHTSQAALDALKLQLFDPDGSAPSAFIARSSASSGPKVPELPFLCSLATVVGIETLQRLLQLCLDRNIIDPYVSEMLIGLLRHGGPTQHPASVQTLVKRLFALQIPVSAAESVLIEKHTALKYSPPASQPGHSFLSGVDVAVCDAAASAARVSLSGLAHHLRRLTRLSEVAAVIDQANAAMSDASRISEGLVSALKSAFAAEVLHGNGNREMRAIATRGFDSATAVSDAMRPFKAATEALLSSSSAAIDAAETKLSMMGNATASGSEHASPSIATLLRQVQDGTATYCESFRVTDATRAAGGPSSAKAADMATTSNAVAPGLLSIPTKASKKMPKVKAGAGAGRAAALQPPALPPASSSPTLPTASASASELMDGTLASWAEELLILRNPLDLPLRVTLNAIDKITGSEFAAMEAQVLAMASVSIASAQQLVEAQSREVTAPLEQQLAYLQGVHARASRDSDVSRQAFELEQQIDALRSEQGAARKKARNAKSELEDAEDDRRVVTNEHRQRVETLQAAVMSLNRRLETALAQLHALAETGVPQAVALAALCRLVVAGSSSAAGGDGGSGSLSELEAHWQALVQAGIAIDGRSIDDYCNVAPLQHSNSVVFTARLRGYDDDGSRKILKEYVIGRDDQVFINEITALRSLNHPNIIALEAAVRDKSKHRLYLQFPQAEAGNLRQWLSAAPRSIDDRITVFQGIIHGLSYLHSKHIVHRDLKPENILITADGVPRLADFGLAYQERSALMTMIPTDAVAAFGAGTEQYKSPEQLRGERVTTSSDLYACGLVLYELLLDRQYPVATVTRALPSTDSASAPALPSSPVDFATLSSPGLAHAVADVALQLLRRLLSADAADRPTAHAVLVDPVFAVRHGGTTASPAHVNVPQRGGHQAGAAPEHPAVAAAREQLSKAYDAAKPVRSRVAAGARMFGSVAEALVGYGLAHSESASPKPGAAAPSAFRLVLERDLQTSPSASASNAAAGRGAGASAAAGDEGVAVDTERCLDAFLTQCLSKEAGLFETADDDSAAVLPLANCHDDTKLLQLKAFGIALGQCLLNFLPLDIATRLPLVLYRCLLQGPSTVARSTGLDQALTDLSGFDRQLAQQYRIMLSTTGVQDLMLPGGRSERGLTTDISDANKHEVLRRSCIERVVSSRLQGIEAIRTGLLSTQIAGHVSLQQLVQSLPAADALRDLLFNTFVRQRREQLRRDDEASSAAAIATTRPCPRCGVRIEKNGGCDHMRCASCGHPYNWSQSGDGVQGR